MKTALYTLALILLASPAMAERADHDAALLQLLAGIDTLPTRADLERVADDPQLALVKVALDHTMPLYERRRATSLLSFFPDAASEAYLTLIAATSAAPRVRWMAVYTYVRRFGELKPDRVVGYARQGLKSPKPPAPPAPATGRPGPHPHGPRGRCQGPALGAVGESDRGPRIGRALGERCESGRRDQTGARAAPSQTLKGYWQGSVTFTLST